MEVLALCALALVIARYAYKQAKYISYMCSLLFALIFMLSLFTTQIPFVKELMQAISGEENYILIRLMLIKPCVWIYSASAAAALTELFIAAVIAVAAANKALKKLKKIKKTFYHKVNNEVKWAEPPETLFAVRKLFLKCCRLLN